MEQFWVASSFHQLIFSLLVGSNGYHCENSWLILTPNQNMKNVHTEHIKGQNSYFLVVPFPMPRSIKWENTYFMKTLKRYIYIFEQSLKISGRSQENMLLVHCLSMWTLEMHRLTGQWLESAVFFARSARIGDRPVSLTSCRFQAAPFIPSGAGRDVTAMRTLTVACKHVVSHENDSNLKWHSA